MSTFTLEILNNSAEKLTSKIYIFINDIGPQNKETVKSITDQICDLGLFDEPTVNDLRFNEKTQLEKLRDVINAVVLHEKLNSQSKTTEIVFNKLVNLNGLDIFSAAIRTFIKNELKEYVKITQNFKEEPRKFKYEQDTLGKYLQGSSQVGLSAAGRSESIEKNISDRPSVSRNNSNKSSNTFKNNVGNGVSIIPNSHEETKGSPSRIHKGYEGSRSSEHRRPHYQDLRHLSSFELNKFPLLRSLTSLIPIAISIAIVVVLLHILFHKSKTDQEINFRNGSVSGTGISAENLGRTENTDVNHNMSVDVSENRKQNRKFDFGNDFTSKFIVDSLEQLLGHISEINPKHPISLEIRVNSILKWGIRDNVNIFDGLSVSSLVLNGPFINNLTLALLYQMRYMPTLKFLNSENGECEENQNDFQIRKEEFPVLKEITFNGTQLCSETLDLFASYVKSESLEFVVFESFEFRELYFLALYKFLHQNRKTLRRLTFTHTIYEEKILTVSLGTFPLLNQIVFDKKGIQRVTGEFPVIKQNLCNIFPNLKMIECQFCGLSLESLLGCNSLENLQMVIPIQEGEYGFNVSEFVSDIPTLSSTILELRVPHCSNGLRVKLLGKENLLISLRLVTIKSKCPLEIHKGLHTGGLQREVETYSTTYYYFISLNLN